MMNHVEKEKVEADNTLLSAAPKDQPHASEPFDSSTAFIQDQQEYRPSEEAWHFSGFHKFFLELKVTYITYVFENYSTKVSQYFLREWSTAS